MGDAVAVKSLAGLSRLFIRRTVISGKNDFADFAETAGSSFAFTLARTLSL
jgi:hypothetical protein